MKPAEVNLDTLRRDRTGVPEVIYAEGKLTHTVLASLDMLRAADPRAALATRCSDDLLEAAARHFGEHASIDPVARTITVGHTAPMEGSAAILTAGTTDLPVAYECRNAASAFGLPTILISDVGVAGLHRLLDRIADISTHSVVIVVAGMDGALPGVVAGLISAPVIAVPTSIGYGVASGGYAALNTMLASCSPGVAVVNIDNGVGAAALAVRILASHRSGQL